MSDIEITMLNGMAAGDFEISLNRHVEWGLRWLDLKDGIYGKSLIHLTDDEARRAAQAISMRGLDVYCLSFGLFHDDIEKGAEHFRSAHAARVERATELARIFQPQFVRLLAAWSSRRREFADGMAYIDESHPWLMPLYREASDRILNAGFAPTVENEVGGCLLSNPDEILGFFARLDRKVCFTWDVQNLWQEGTYPSLEVYRALKPLIGYFHLKGGQKGNGPSLTWSSALADASWPVEEITAAVIRDGVSPVICLNPSHGARRPDYDYHGVVERDLAFVKGSDREDKIGMTYQREFESRLNVAMIGAGSHAYRNLLPALNFLPVNLRAVCDLNLPLARAVGEQYNANAYADTGELYRNEALDAVFISAGPAAHPSLVIEAFEHGLHVWTEKPISVRAADVLPMIAARGDRTAVVGLKKAFMPATTKVLEVLSQPQVGELSTILAQYPMRIPRDGARLLEERRFTNWLGNGCHPLSLILRVGGSATAVTTHRSKWDDGTCIIELAGGAIATFHLGAGPGGSQPMERYAFFAPGAVVTIENALKVIWQRGAPMDYGRTTSYAEGGADSGAIVWEPQNTLATLENMALFTQGFYAEMRYFCDRALAGEPAEQGTLEFAYHIMQVYEAALLSDGDRVEIPAGILAVD